MKGNVDMESLEPAQKKNKLMKEGDEEDVILLD